MVKKSNLKMGIVPKLTHKKTPDISHLTGVQCSKEHITEFEVRHKDGSFDIVTVYDLPEDLAIKWIEIKYPDSHYLRLKAVNYLLNRFGI